jgi:hypothetical protein
VVEFVCGYKINHADANIKKPNLTIDGGVPYALKCGADYYSGSLGINEYQMFMFTGSSFDVLYKLNADEIKTYVDEQIAAIPTPDMSDYEIKIENKKDKDLIVTYAEGSTFGVTHST